MRRYSFLTIVLALGSVGLAALEAEHPELQSPDSPTQRVGAVTAGALPKHIHQRPMLSLVNAFSAEELAG